MNVYVGNRGAELKAGRVQDAVDPDFRIECAPCLILDTNEYDFNASFSVAYALDHERRRVLQEKAISIYDAMFKAGEQVREITYPYGKPIKASRRNDATRYAGVELPLSAFKTTAPQGRYTTPEMRSQVWHLHGRRFLVEAIADTLNLKDSRVRRLIREGLNGSSR